MANLTPPLWQRFFDANAAPGIGWKLYTYLAGTSTPTATYTDESALTPNTNPVVFDSEGYADIWLEPGSYKFVLADENDVVIRTVDNVTATSGGGSSLPVGGTINQALTKLSSTNFHVGWATIDKTFVGLGNVDNTSDAAKPISTATQAALDGKEPTIAPGSDGQVWTMVGGVKTWATLASGADTVFGSTGTPRSIVAGTGITSGASHMSTTVAGQTIFLKGSVAGESDISANPQIQAGTIVGQRMRLVGASDTDFIKLEDGDGLYLNGPWNSFNHAILELLWDGTVWVEIARSA